MSVFGGDSWARGAQYRKRKVDDLLIDSLDTSSYKKLPSGKFTCLICSNNPILDTPLMLSMHVKGSRHRDAESRLKERELARQQEINKRIALSDCSISVANSGTSTQRHCLASKPLIEQTRKTASEIINNRTHSSTAYAAYSVISSDSHFTNGPSASDSIGCSVEIEEAGKEIVQHKSDFQERRERELKFTAAGWKRDCHGKWFRDENVEFDSDEEDPNVCLV